MVAQGPKVSETEILECIAGPLCGRRFKIHKSARGLALNATMTSRFKREAREAGIIYRHGAYLREVWRKGEQKLVWTEMPIPTAFGRAR